MQLLSRDDAIAAKLKRYVDGKPCPYGHIGERYVKGRGCVTCALETSKAKYRVERTINLEKLRIKQTLAMRKYRKKHPNPRAGKHGREPADPLTRHNRILASQLRSRIKNRENHRQQQKRWRSRNLVSHRTKQAARRAQQRDSGGHYTVEQVLSLLKKQRGKCANCFKDIRRAYHCDHITPLALNGRNDITNIQLLCPVCNAKKGSKDPIMFAQQNGRLL